MTPTRLEYARQRMQQTWYELVQAEQQGASLEMLERMFQVYMRSVEEFNACSASHEDEPRRQQNKRKRKVS